MVSNPTKSVPQNFHEVRRSLVSSGIKGCTISEVEDAVPVYTSVRSSAYRKRMKLVPKLPTKLSELILENEWRSTNDRKDFLLGNYFFMTTWEVGTAQSVNNTNH